jgi:ferric-dicitrate binding protein FerR (iron transport regulator)
MKDERFYQIIHRELTGQLEVEDRKELRSLESDPDFAHVRKELKSIWDVSEEYFPKESFDKDAAKARFMERISNEKESVSQAKPSNLKLLTAIAMVITITVLALIYFAFQQSQITEEPQVIEQLEYAVLEDGSEIWTNEYAIVQVANFENSAERIVSLAGEAYFRVPYIEDKPFIVDLGNGDRLQVVGTSFNVKVDQTKREHTVHVNQGRVIISSESNPELTLELSEGQYGIYNATEGTSVPYQSNQSFSFFSEDLTFENAPLPTVLAKVEKYFKVKFDISDDAALNNCLITSTTPLLDNFTVPEIIEVLRAVHESVKFERISDRKYKVSGTCPPGQLE